MLNGLPGEASKDELLRELFCCARPHNRACTLGLRMLQYLDINVLKMKRRIAFMKLGIVESEPVSMSLRKRTNADKA